MGLCWSEPPAPVQQVPVVASYGQPCKRCGLWNPKDYCEKCLQQNAMSYIAPSAPMYPPQQPQPQYTYAVMPQQQQMYQYQYYQARPPIQQQPQMGLGTAVLGGFMLGAITEDILDPTD